MNYYDVLEISSKASQEVIRMAYKALIKKYHPDTYQGDYLIAENKTKKIIEAFEVLSDPEKRHLYDCQQENYRFAKANYQNRKATAVKRETERQTASTRDEPSAHNHTQPVMEKNREPADNRDVGIAITIGIIVVVLVFAFMGYQSSMQAKANFEHFVAEGDKFFSEDKYDLAVMSYKSALNAKHDKALKLQYDLAVALSQSNNNYQQAEYEYGKNNYQESLLCYQQVITEDTNYTKAQEMILEITEIIANDFLNQAKKQRSKYTIG